VINLGLLAPGAELQKQNRVPLRYLKYKLKNAWTDLYVSE